MTAIVLPDLSQRSLSDLRDRLAEMDTPSLQEVGKSADHAIDRLLGRSRTPMWTWIAVGIGLVAVVGIVSAWFAMLRRPVWSQSTSAPLGTASSDDPGDADMIGVAETIEFSSLRDDDVLNAIRANATPIEDA